MHAQIRLGRILGIEIGLHYSWLIIALLITLSLSGQFHASNPAWSDFVIWLAAIATSFLFFLSIVAHELSHSLVARAHGLAVRSITLFALGGVSQTEKDSPDSRTEFWMAIAGPISSAIIGLGCLGIAWSLGWQPPQEPASPVAGVLVWLGYINVLLAAFNMIPGFPLDGGRVLRGIIWWFTNDRQRATNIAAQTGQVVAYFFIVVGLVRFFGGAGLGGLWISFIGWFLLDAARGTQAETGIAEMLRGVRVGDVMSRDNITVDGHTNIQTLADEHFLRSGRRCIIVAENGKVAGLITPNEVRRIPPARWPYTTVDEVMRALDELRSVTADTPVMTALEIMARDDVNQLPVLFNGILEGIVSRAHILQLLQTRTELGRGVVPRKEPPGPG
jgi:Zn-dependent protease/predicted transcriptional regulator